MTVTDLVASGEAFHEALGREYYATGAGHKAEPAFQAIYDRHADLLADETLDAARDAGSPAVVEWLVDLRVGRRVAPLEERQLVWEQDAVVVVPERSVPYLRVPIELQNTADRPLRLALDRERSRVAQGGLVDLRRSRFELEHEVLRDLGWDDYVGAMAALSGIDLDDLGAQAGRLLEDTRDLYEDVLPRLVRRRDAAPLDDLMRADVAWTFRAGAFDEAFPPATLVDTARRQLREMGMDAGQGGRIHFDTVDRERKQPRAFCVPVRVPDEVYLVLRPRGGHTDYRTFWHELGHAVHFASVDPARPFEHRWLGDNSVTEGFAMLFDALTMDAGWIGRYTDLGQGGGGADRQIRDLVFELAVNELYMLRRYAAKLQYELLLHRGAFTAMGPTYAERLTSATGFRYPESDALLDVDPGFYAARYLRAWQLSALLADHFTQHYDVDWYRNPRAGSAVGHLMSRGQADPADRLAADVVGRPLSFAPCVARLEAALT